MNEFIEQFLLEARELIAQATSDLMALEQQSDDLERLDSVFRAFHTLKGAAGIVEFEPMGRALHAVESVLASFRSRANSASPAIIDECLACLDQVTWWLNDMEVTGEAPQDAGVAADAIVQRFAGLTIDEAEPDTTPPDQDWMGRLRDGNPEAFSRARTALRYTADAEAFFRGEDPLALLQGLPGLIAIDLAQSGPSRPFDEINPFTCAIAIAALTSADAGTVTRMLNEASDQVEVRTVDVQADQAPNSVISPKARSILEAQVLLLREPGQHGRAGRAASAGRVSINVLRHAGLTSAATSLEQKLDHAPSDDDGSAIVATIEHLLQDKPQGQRPAPVGTRLPVAARVLRVDTARIDALVNLTGELTVVKNALGHLANLAQDGLDAKAVAAGLRDQQTQLDRLVGEVQRAVLRIRVLPMRQVFQRFPRLVREISGSIGKSIKFVVEGDDTEADTAIVESLFEPLLHVLRNAVDHGIETSAERTASGKEATARVVLRASRHLDNVIIEIDDDGRGVDVARIREVAAARGVLEADALADMADSDVVNLIFAPGFSTAKEVTDLSGRGVGMDAVRAAVERLGGRVSIESRPKLGTTVRLTLPFTAMMTRVMTVEAGSQVFGLPLDMVVETAMIARDRIVPIGKAAAFAWRYKTVPLVNLVESLGLTAQSAKMGQARVVITSVGGRFGAVEVERLGERMDVMLKPMQGLLGGLKGVAGTTLLGDGRVLIVLDVQELFN
jgi:two-component system, chemotaxis family, sensor kinase CheA